MIRFSIIASLLVGCASGPVADNLSWTTKNIDTVTRTSYHLSVGGDPIETVGAVGTAGDCISAGLSAGTFTSVTNAETFVKSKALGSTEVYHPLVPNSEKFSSALATVVQERTRGTSSQMAMSTFYDSEVGTITTTTYTDAEIETEASFYGISADEYVVRFPLSNLWMNPDEEITVGDVELLSRADVGTGDIWASTNGNTVYVASVKEPKTFGAMTKNAQKVFAYEVGGLQPEGGDIITQCFYLGLEQGQSTDVAIEARANSNVFLDSGCTDVFEHFKVGTQWWYKNIMVKETATLYDIEITDYGYEWYELNETSDACTRMTSVTLPSATAATAIQFVQYDLITTEHTSSVVNWTE
jgi:hypothetical protein